MSSNVKPCAYCGNGTFHYLPGMRHHVMTEGTLLGMNITKEVSGRYWTFTLVVCTQCGCTQTFTKNAAEMAQWVAGSAIVSTK
jgi:hypothetical protein